VKLICKKSKSKDSLKFEKIVLGSSEKICWTDIKNNWQRTISVLELGELWTGTDVMILKVFSTKKLAKKLAKKLPFFTQTSYILLVFAEV
jgi:hypothetical protein